MLDGSHPDPGRAPPGGHDGGDRGFFGPRGGAGDPAQRRTSLERWRDDVARVAERPHVVAKHSGLGMPVLGGTSRRQLGADSLAEFADHAAPLVRHLHDCFGDDRTMWASNYPMDMPVLSVPATAQVVLDVLGSDARPQQLFHDVASRTYRIQEPTSARLDDQVVLISGAGGGIGAARRLHARGACVVLADLNATALTALVSELGDPPAARSCSTWCGPTPAPPAAEQPPALRGRPDRRPSRTSGGSTSSSRPRLAAPVSQHRRVRREFLHPVGGKLQWMPAATSRYF